MRKLFEVLFGLVTVLIIILTIVNNYLLFLWIGALCTMFLVFFCCDGDTNWMLTMSIASAFALSVLWAVNSTDVGILLQLVIGAFYPSIVAKVYLSHFLNKN